MVREDLWQTRKNSEEQSYQIPWIVLLNYKLSLRRAFGHWTFQALLKILSMLASLLFHIEKYVSFEINSSRSHYFEERRRKESKNSNGNIRQPLAGSEMSGRFPVLWNLLHSLSMESVVHSFPFFAWSSSFSSPAGSHVLPPSLVPSCPLPIRWSYRTFCNKCWYISKELLKKQRVDLPRLKWEQH